MYELIFLKILLQFSILVCQSVPKSYTSIFLIQVFCIQWRIWIGKWFLSCLVQENSLSYVQPDTQEVPRFDWHYSVKQLLTFVRVFHHFLKHLLAKPNRFYSFIGISVTQMTNLKFQKFWIKTEVAQG